jgi:nucleotide-binding universal stress UspA family protein
MTYKTILAHAGIWKEAGDPVPAALSLGDRFGSTVVGLGAAAWDPYVDPTLGYVHAATITLLRQDIGEDVKAAETRFRAAGQAYRHPTIWRPSFDYPTQALLDRSGGADLVVATRTPKDGDLRYCLDAAEVVMRSGLPVLLIPDGQTSIGLSTVVVAWKNTAATRRAVSAALPLLKAAERVVVVQICRPGEEQDAEPRLEDVTQRLERHGVVAEWQTFPWLGVEADEDLEAVARSWAADVVVMGAYGYTRLREWAWGGVSRDVLAAFPVPVLMTH